MINSRVGVHVFETTGVNESRFLKESGSLLREGIVDDVVLVGRWRPGHAPEQELADRIRVKRLPRVTSGLPRGAGFAALKMLEAQWRYWWATRALRPAVIHCHGVFSLAASVAAKLATGAPLVYDPHELETERNGVAGLRQAADRYIERRLIRSCDAVMCVSDSIADWYANEYRIRRPAVVRNIPDLRLQQGGGNESILKRRLGIPESDLLFIYQGGLFRGRRIDQLIRVFERVQPRRHLVLMGYGELEETAKAAAARIPNIHFHPAVPPGEVLKHTSSADVGLTGVENVCLSYYYSLPNKLFEYLSAGIPFLVPAYPEMARLIEQHGCGWVVGEDDDAWIRVIDELTAPAIAKARAAVQTTAGTYSWANEESVLIETYRRVLNGSSGMAVEVLS
jgi:glycosyltransferase involved in cell wall biosynthesis